MTNEYLSELEIKEMNMRLVIFSGIVMAIVGSVLGLGVSKISQERYQCCNSFLTDDIGYSRARAPKEYASVGALMGFIAGSALESVRQAQSSETEQD